MVRPWESNPRPSRSVFKRSTDWANPAGSKLKTQFSKEIVRSTYKKKISSGRLKLSHCLGNDKSHLAMTMLSTVEQLQYCEHVWFGEKSAFTQKKETRQASDNSNTWWVGDFISFLSLQEKMINIYFS